jgi:hypothetical protein
MKKLFILLVGMSCLTAKAQQVNLTDTADKIERQGKMLHQSERASWLGTDIFVDKCQRQRTIAGGYLSYINGNESVNIFFSKDDKPRVLATITFNESYTLNKLDTTIREFKQIEADLYSIRKKALTAINSDTLFKRYNNTSLNLIPIIDGKLRQVYVLTGPNVNGVVIFGNDYLIDFDEQNNIVTKRRLHKNLIAIETKNPAESSAHSHLPETGSFITPTDICTLMLYEKSAGWNFHVVISKDYVSSWHCPKNQLVILTRKAWEAISSDAKERHPEKQ